MTFCGFYLEIFRCINIEVTDVKMVFVGKVLVCPRFGLKSRQDQKSNSLFSWNRSMKSYSYQIYTDFNERVFTKTLIVLQKVNIFTYSVTLLSMFRIFLSSNNNKVFCRSLVEE